MLIRLIDVSKAIDPQTRIVRPEFDPLSASGTLVTARIDDLIARGKRAPAPKT